MEDNGWFIALSMFRNIYLRSLESDTIDVMVERKQITRLLNVLLILYRGWRVPSVVLLGYYTLSAL